MVQKIDWMTAELLLLLWPVTTFFGLLYLGIRDEWRDLILHLGLHVAIGLSAAAAACFGMWLIFGGWGLPSPELFGFTGLLGGILIGWARFKSASLRDH
jgi:hypothetical protein